MNGELQIDYFFYLFNKKLKMNKSLETSNVTCFLRSHMNDKIFCDHFLKDYPFKINIRIVLKMNNQSELHYCTTKKNDIGYKHKLNIGDEFQIDFGPKWIKDLNLKFAVDFDGINVLYGEKIQTKLRPCIEDCYLLDHGYKLYIPSFNIIPPKLPLGFVSYEQLWEKESEERYSSMWCADLFATLMNVID